MLSIIVAASSNGAIGKNNGLLWHLPNDLLFFKNTTWGMPVIMGRKTFESVNKPLPGRFNIVISAQPDWSREGVIKASSLDNAIEKAQETNCLEIFIAGGGEIYRQAMDRANRIYLTRVHAELEGDTFFPPLDENIWKLVFSEEFEADNRNMYAHEFQRWERR